MSDSPDIEIIVEPTFEEFRKNPTSARQAFLSRVVIYHAVDRARLVSDAEDLESGRWRIGNQDGDQSSSTASSKRSLAARLLGLSKAYEDLDE
jgi:hypothetical protein